MHPTPTIEVFVTSIRRPAGNTGITGGIKGINNKVPTSKTSKTDAAKKTDKAHTGKFEKTDNKKPGWNPTPNKPPLAR